ncbi:MAG: hypothetical protein N3A59_01245 [Thermodesulfovibrionales bacterium]|nr:hypothetical protein [Thermodesulfovibrionales bacterium]
MIDILDLSFQIKRNCDISDAKYWGYFSLCGLLLRLRQLYRSEKNLPPWSNIELKDIGEWINNKESLWASLENQSYKNLTINSSVFNPFEISEINSLLLEEKFIYGAGLGLYKKPLFFIGELFYQTKIDDFHIYYVKNEIARDLFASAGMLQNNVIFIRLDQIKTLLWEVFCDLKGRKNDLFEMVFSNLEISSEDTLSSEFVEKFDNLTMNFSHIILDHELAEAHEASENLREIVLSTEDRKIEYFLRDLKDKISDTSPKGPLKRIIQNQDKASLCFYISLLEIYHKAFYSHLRIAFEDFLRSQDWLILESLRQKLYNQSLRVREKILSAYNLFENSKEFYERLKEIMIDKEEGSYG